MFLNFAYPPFNLPLQRRSSAKDAQDGAAHQIYDKEKELTVCAYYLRYLAMFVLIPSQMHLTAVTSEAGYKSTQTSKSGEFEVPVWRPIQCYIKPVDET